MTSGMSVFPKIILLRIMWKVVRAFWRYFITGKKVLAGLDDNASFRDDATIDHRGEPREKLSRARWRRVARRWALIGVPFLFALVAGSARVARWMGSGGWAALPYGSLAAGYVIMLALVALGIGVRWLALELPQREVRRQFILPAAGVLSDILKVKIRKQDAYRLIELPPGHGTKESSGAVRVTMPKNVALDPGTKTRIETQLGARLGLPSPKGAWHEAETRAYVELSAASLPPKDVVLDTLIKLASETDIDHPLAGITTGSAPVYLDFLNDSPHVLASAGSGAGKSTFLRWLAMQRLQKGSYGVFLDFKKWSHYRWVRLLGSDRVAYFWDIEPIHNALCMILQELTWRKNLNTDEELDALTTLDIFVEELNTLTPMLRDYWTEYVARQKAEARASGDEEMLAVANGLPKISPAIQALKYGVNLGREFKVHFWYIGQSLSANSLPGGRDARGSFKIRALAAWDAKDWKMLADGTPFVQWPSGQPRGLWAIVANGLATLVRVPFLANEAVATFVASGQAPAKVGHVATLATASQVGHVATLELAGPATLANLAGQLPAKPDGQRLTLDGLKTASRRPGFPAAVGEGVRGAGLYEVDAVQAWFASRYTQS